MTFLSDAELECLLLSFDIDESELHVGNDSDDYSGNNSDDVDDCEVDVPYAHDTIKWLRERDQARNQELNEHFRSVFESSDTNQRRVSPINPYMLTMRQVPPSRFRPIEFGQW